MRQHLNPHICQAGNTLQSNVANFIVVAYLHIARVFVRQIENRERKMKRRTNLYPRRRFAPVGAVSRGAARVPGCGPVAELARARGLLGAAARGEDTARVAPAGAHRAPYVPRAGTFFATAFIKATECRLATAAQGTIYRGILVAFPLFPGCGALPVVLGEGYRVGLSEYVWTFELTLRTNLQTRGS